MRTTKSWATVAIAGATVTLMAVTAAPAAAATATGVADSFFNRCDASVFISDTLTGSDGKVEAWGGFSCPQSLKFIGQIKIELKNGTKTVAKKQIAVNASTDSVSATVVNSKGKQRWHADLKIFRPGFDTWIVSTGDIKS